MRRLLTLGVLLMAFNAKEATFAWNTADVAGTDYDVTFGAGFGTPVFFIVMCGGTISATDSLVTNRPICLGFGFGTSESNRRSMMFISEDAATLAAYTIGHREDAIVTTNAGLLDVDTNASWPTDGIRFTVDVQLNAFFGNLRITVLAFSGSDITAKNAFTIQEHTSAATQAYAHGLGATPTGALFCSVAWGTAPSGTAQTQGSISIGAADGTNEGVIWLGGDDGNTTMDTKGYAKSGEAIVMGPEPPTTINAIATDVTFDATNINITWQQRAATRYVFVLAWTGGQFAVKTTTTRTDTTQFSGPTNGFVSKASMFTSAMRAASTTDTPTDHGQFSIGVATSASSRIAHFGNDEDAIGTSEVSVGVETDAVYGSIVNTTHALDGLMDVVDLTVDPMQLVMDDADATAGRFVNVWSWGANAGGAAATPHGPLGLPLHGPLGRVFG